MNNETLSRHVLDTCSRISITASLLRVAEIDRIAFIEIRESNKLESTHISQAANPEKKIKKKLYIFNLIPKKCKFLLSPVAQTAIKIFIEIPFDELTGLNGFANAILQNV